jgi:hypothetical protein
MRDTGGGRRKRTNLVVDESSERKVVEEVGEVLPDVRISILPQALVVETVNLSDLSRLVVTTEDRNAVPVPNLEGDEEGDGLDRVVSSVNVVSHEEVVRVGRVTANAEELGEIVLKKERKRRISDFDGRERRGDVRIGRECHRRPSPGT